MTRKEMKSVLSRLEYISEKSELNPVEWENALRTLKEFFEECKSKEEMQHEIGNPLFAIETNCEFLKKRIHDPDKAAKVLDDIQESIEKIKLVIN